MSDSAPLPSWCDRRDDSWVLLGERRDDGWIVFGRFGVKKSFHALVYFGGIKILENK